MLFINFLAVKPEEPVATGAILVVTAIGLFFLLSRLAYIKDLRRRRRMTPEERRIEKGEDLH